MSKVFITPCSQSQVMLLKTPHLNIGFYWRRPLTNNQATGKTLSLNAVLGQRPDLVVDRQSFNELVFSDSKVQKLYKKLNYRFKSPKLLVNALIHRSFFHEFEQFELKHNEKLEFLGDSIFNMIITMLLMEKLGETLDEGQLSKLRGALVNENQLAEFAQTLGLGECILLGRGERKKQGHKRKSILSDTFEAVVAAVYLDSDINTTKRVFSEFLQGNYDDLFSIKRLVEFDAKSQLQELTMAKFKVLPRYDFSEIENGTAFNVKVFIEDVLLIEGKGPSKKKLEKKLAKDILQQQLWKKFNRSLSC